MLPQTLACRALAVSVLWSLAGLPGASLVGAGGAGVWSPLPRRIPGSLQRGARLGVALRSLRGCVHGAGGCEPSSAFECVCPACADGHADHQVLPLGQWLDDTGQRSASCRHVGLPVPVLAPRQPAPGLPWCPSSRAESSPAFCGGAVGWRERVSSPPDPPGPDLGGSMGGSRITQS